MKFIGFCIFSIKYHPPAGKTVYLNKVINIFEKTSLYLIILSYIKASKKAQIKH